jgi:hypothetical protein
VKLIIKLKYDIHYEFFLHICSLVQIFSVIVNKTYKKYIFYILLFTFIIPFIIKATHFLYVHHEHCHITFSDKTAINKTHKECPICAFDYAQFVKTTVSYQLGKVEFISDYTIKDTEKAKIQASKHSFFLRAPPVY